MRRREALQMSALASLITALGCDDQRATAKPAPSGGPPSQAMKAEVLVVGAGMAGLSAAKLLGAKGKRVIVVEGRDRVGGRVWTDRSLGAPFDMGASWIHGQSDNPLAELARKLGVKTVETQFEDLHLFDHDGSGVNDSEAEKIADAWEKLLGEVEQQSAFLSGDVSRAAAIQEALAGEKLDTSERRILDWLGSTVALAEGEDLDRVSLIGGDDDEGFPGGDALIPGGYDRLIEAQGQSLDVRLEHRVTLIEHGGEGVVVHTDKGRLEGEQAIITLPLGVLKKGSVKFVPALDAKKTKAIDQLGFGVVNKVVMVFEKTFWPTDRDFLGYMSKTKREFPVYLNCRKFSDVHALVAFTGGSFARRIESMADEEVIERAHAPLRKMFGDAAPRPAKHLVARWSADPFALGSYSNLPIHARAHLFDTLAAPIENRLFFAGEATIRKHPGTVHGAMMSGLREARRILAG